MLPPVTEGANQARAQRSPSAYGRTGLYLGGEWGLGVGDGKAMGWESVGIDVEDKPGKTKRVSAVISGTLRRGEWGARGREMNMRTKPERDC